MIEAEDQERSRKKKKRKKQGNSTWIVLGIVGSVFLVAGVIIVVVVVNLPRGNAQAKGDAPPDQKAAPQPAPQEGAQRPKVINQPKGVVESIRNAAYRPQRINDLKQIALLFNQFVGEFNRNPRTKEEFMQYIQRDAASVVEALKEDYYVLNLRAKLSSESVIAYEKLTEAACHQTARGDGSVGLVAPDELQRMLAQ